MIFKTLFGSHLYGLNTPASDKDYKGIDIPEALDIVMQRAYRTKNTTTKTGDRIKNDSTDEELEVFALHKFIQLCDEGQTVAIDMLFAPESFWLKSSKEWEFIQANRSKLISNKINAMIGYCLTQTAKYGVKGSRVYAAKQVMEFMEPYLKTTNVSTGGPIRLGNIWDEMKTALGGIDHINFIKTLTPSADLHMKEVDTLEVCNKKQHIGVTVKQAYECFAKIYNEYGARAKLAEKNQSVDFKAVSHAFRVLFEAQELLLTGHVTFPLVEKDFLLAVKTGQLDYKTVIVPRLDSELNVLRTAQAVSILPDKIDMDFWEDWLMRTYGQRISSRIAMNELIRLGQEIGYDEEIIEYKDGCIWACRHGSEKE